MNAANFVLLIRKYILSIYLNKNCIDEIVRLTNEIKRLKKIYLYTINDYDIKYYVIEMTVIANTLKLAHLILFGQLLKAHFQLMGFATNFIADIATCGCGYDRFVIV